MPPSARPTTTRRRTVVARAERAVAAGGDINDSIVITGDSNVVGDRNIVLNIATDADVPEIIGKIKEVLGSTTRPRVVDLDGLAELWTILRKCRFESEQVDPIFYECIPPIGNVGQIYGLWNMIDELSAFPKESASDRLPLLEFVKRLAPLVQDAGVRTELNRWSDSLAFLFGLSARTTLTAPQRSYAYVLVELRPSLRNPNLGSQKLYHPEISFCGSETAVPVIWYTDDGSALPLSQMPARLEAVLTDRNNIKQIPAGAPLAFEFILPYELLPEAIEWWERSGARLRESYATRYPVVVRLWERLTIEDELSRKECFDAWNERWRTFHAEIENGASGGDIRKVCWLEAELRGVHFALRRQLHIGCVGLAQTPANGQLLDAFIDVGIPVAIWQRTQVGASDLHAVLDADAATHSVTELRIWVRELRQRAAENEGLAAGDAIVGRQLALLWDDPRRIPVKYTELGALA